MLDIQLEKLDHETRMKLLPREQEVVKELEENGTRKKRTHQCHRNPSKEQ